MHRNRKGYLLPFWATVSIEGRHVLLSVGSQVMARHGEDADPFGEPQDDPIHITPYLDGDPADASEDALRAAAEEALEDLGYELDEVALNVEADRV